AEGSRVASLGVRTPADEKRARAKHSVSAHPAIVINSRAAAMAAGEAWAGAARGKNNVVYLSIGEEIEAGIIVYWRVVQGARGVSGAAGGGPRPAGALKRILMRPAVFPP